MVGEREPDDWVWGLPGELLGTLAATVEGCLGAVEQEGTRSSRSAPEQRERRKDKQRTLVL